MSDFEDVKPYTQAELDQQAIWADEFAQWWEDEGQYQRAGGGQYERSFAWWAWLDREQSKQAIIDNLKAQLNNMEACYIQVKKERDELHAVLECVSEHFVMNDLDGCMPRVFEMIQEALRGAND